ncbi:MAG: sensor histidine kinase [Calditrichaeota bacterium]|nr:MAG: sensor histidine kinase [Calditrichota bacterium]
MKINKKPILFFYALVAICLVELLWWTFLLINSNSEIYEYRNEIIELQRVKAKYELVDLIRSGKFHFKSQPDKIDTSKITAFIENQYPKFEFIFLEEGNIYNSIDLKIKPSVTEKFEDKLHRRWVMFISESSFFVIMILLGIFQIYRSFKSEVDLNSQQKNFLLSITHELKSPLASIKLYLETILKRDLSKEQISEFATSSVKDIDRLNDLVENMLIATKIENQAYTYPKNEINLSVVLQEIIEKFEKSLPETASLKTKIDEGIKIFGDVFTLKIVFLNLLENALKYSGKNAEIKINLEQLGSNIFIKISDNGVGIPEKEQSKVFGKFYRIGNEKTRTTKGTGLGLYIVKEVVERHSGKIQIEPNEPKGTIFNLTFSKET